MDFKLPLIGVLAVSVYTLSTVRLAAVPRASLVQELQVALPRFVQVIMTGGDRFLAANVATWRSLVASSEKMQRDNFAVQGRLQRDAAWFNPAHEDNYYVAAAILPWEGELAAAQYVLKKAGAARPFDWNPYFYLGFNVYYFEKNPVAAAEWLRRAATQARLEDDAYVLETIAASWYEKGYQASVASRVIGSMAATARSGGFRRYLQKRADRLESLFELQAAAERYVKLRGESIKTIADLVGAGLIDSVPVDPFGVGFGVDAGGKPVFRNQGGAGK